MMTGPKAPTAAQSAAFNQEFGRAILARIMQEAERLAKDREAAK